MKKAQPHVIGPFPEVSERPGSFSTATANAVILYRSSSFAFPSRERGEGEWSYLTSWREEGSFGRIRGSCNKHARRASNEREERRTTVDASRGRAKHSGSRRWNHH